MLTEPQLNHFNTFGFVLVRQAFVPDEMAEIRRETERLLAEAKLSSPDYPDHKAVHPFLELGPMLAHLPEDDRIYKAAEQVLGPGFVWEGSEGNQGRNYHQKEHTWHCDRIGQINLHYRRLKMMIYLQPTTRDAGALRVIPGSHRLPLHQELTGLLSSDLDAAMKHFGVAGCDLPCQALEVEPGDLIMFDHYLFHGVYGIEKGRRYVAVKFAAEPQTEEHYKALQEFNQDASTLHDAFRHSRRPRIRAMVANLLAWEEKAAVAGGG